MVNKIEKIAKGDTLSSNNSQSTLSNPELTVSNEKGLQKFQKDEKKESNWGKTIFTVNVP